MLPLCMCKLWFTTILKEGLDGNQSKFARVYYPNIRSDWHGESMQERKGFF